MYPMLLVVHSLLRWIVLGAGLYAAFAAWRGWRSPGAPKGRTGLPFLVAADLQLLLGLALYMVSPSTGKAMASMGEAMRDPVLRFWAVEHPTTMVLALVALHVGFAKAKRASDAVAHHRVGAIAYTIAFVLLFLGTPWPWTAAGRALFPL